MSLSRLGVMPMGWLALQKGVGALVGLLVSLGLRALYRRLLPAHASFARIAVASVVASFVASLLWNGAWNLLVRWLAVLVGARVGPIRSIVALFDGAVYGASTLLAWSLLYFGIKHFQALQIERERALRAEASAHEARLRALRYQLNPHFLFNTLNAISTLVVERRTSEATRMLARLSEFLRFTLDEQTAHEVPVADEIEFARRYLEIEQVRFADRLRLRIELAADAADALVPSMLLQPLVENAVRYAVAPREEGGTITIAVTAMGDVLQISVSDDGPGLDGFAPNGRGIGLANTRARLQQLYGSRHRFTLRSARPSGLEVLIELPLRGGAVHADLRGAPDFRNVATPMEHR
jgi:two-component system, LytTR family, sensor kinase